MALIDETDLVCSFADGELACGQKFLRFSHPALDDILVRRPTNFVSKLVNLKRRARHLFQREVLRHEHRSPSR